MTVTSDLDAPAPSPAPAVASHDHRGSPVPNWAMIVTRFAELRRRRGLMIAFIVVTIGLPTAFLGIRLVLHAVAPHTYGPAGGYDIYVAMSAGVLYTFGFIVAAALGCSAGSLDLSEGMFRHLVITGRSRLALYLARIPAGLAIVVPLVAIGFAIVCTVCVIAAPTTLSYNGIQMPAQMSQQGLESWAADHATEVICGFPTDNGPATGVGCIASPTGQQVVTGTRGNPVPATQEQAKAAAIEIARRAYPEYASQFTSPPVSLMVKTGLWLELEAVVAFVVGLGLGSLLGQRTVAVILMIVLEIVITPIAVRAQIPHLVNVQRAIVGVATGHLEPGRLPLALGGGGRDYRVTETTTTAVVVILAWVVGWTGIGAWRMMTRDA